MNFMNKWAQGAHTDLRIRVLIGDPDPLVRAAISRGFEECDDFSVIAATGSPRELAELATHYRPEISLIHAGAKEFDGLELCRTILAADPAARVLILERSPSVERELAALWAGAGGVVAKDVGVPGVIEATRAVLSGRLPHSDAAMRLLLERMRLMPESGVGIRPVRSPLTPREWEVLDLLTNQLSTREIAAELHLSKDTVASHIKNLMRKMSVHSREEAVDRGLSLRWPENFEPHGRNGHQTSDGGTELSPARPLLNGKRRAHIQLATENADV